MNTRDEYIHHKSVTVVMVLVTAAAATTAMAWATGQIDIQSNPYGEQFHLSPAKKIREIRLYQIPQNYEIK